MADAFAEPDADETAQSSGDVVDHVGDVKPIAMAGRGVPAEALATSCEDRPGWSYVEVRHQIDDGMRWGYAERSLNFRNDDSGSGSLDPLEMIAIAAEPVDCWRMAAEYIHTLAIELFEAKHRIAEIEQRLTGP